MALIKIYRGVDEAGYASLKATDGGVYGDGVYFYNEPAPSRSHASWPNGGVIVAEVDEKNAIIKGNVVVVKNPEDVIIRGKIPLADTVLSGQEWIDRVNKEFAVKQVAQQPVADAIQHNVLSHSIDLQKYDTNTAKDVKALLQNVASDLEQTVLEGAAYSDTPSLRYARAEHLRQQAIHTIDAAYQQIEGQHTAALVGLGNVEADFALNVVNRTVGVNLAKNMLTNAALDAVISGVMIEGAPSKQWWSRQSESLKNQFGDTMTKGILEGETIPQMVRRVRGTKAMNYSDGIMDASYSRAEALVRTSGMAVANKVREESFAQNADIIKAFKQVATLDHRVCVVCASLDGKTWKPDGTPIGHDKAIPQLPLHWNCLLGDSIVTTRGDVTGASKRWIDGEICIVTTSSGNKLSCTPNHPILTDAGWIAAGLLDVGSNIISNVRSERALLIDGDGENIESTIHEITETFFATSKMIPVPVPVTAEDFHGDGSASKIAVVSTNRFLTDTNQPSLCEHICEHDFISGNSTASLSLVSGGHLAQTVFCAARTFDSLMRFCRKPLAFFGSAASHARKLLFRSTAKRNTLCAQDAKDRSARASKEVSNALGSYTGKVFLDNVISIERVNYSGHVYNLETVGGWYVANGIITHNCRCTRVPVLKSYRELAGLPDAGKIDEGTRASMDGQVPADVTYEQWLKGQPEEAQKAVLGKARFELWKSGKLSMAEMTKPSNQVLTLEQLKSKRISRQGDSFLAEEKAVWEKSLAFTKKDAAKYAENVNANAVFEKVKFVNKVGEIMPDEANAIKAAIDHATKDLKDPSIATNALKKFVLAYDEKEGNTSYYETDTKTMLINTYLKPAKQYGTTITHEFGHSIDAAMRGRNIADELEHVINGTGKESDLTLMLEIERFQAENNVQKGTGNWFAIPSEYATSNVNEWVAEWFTKRILDPVGAERASKFYPVVNKYIDSWLKGK